MSNANLQDSSNPKPPTEGIAESPPRQLAPSMGTLPVKSIASAGSISPMITIREDTHSPVNVNMIQMGGLTRREMKKLTREMNLVEATMEITPEYLGWSEQ